MPAKTERLKLAPVKPSDFGSRTLTSKSLRQFCQHRADHLTVQSGIALARIAYQEPLTQQHEAVWSRREDDWLMPDLLDYLKSETWLFDFPPVLSLSQIPLDSTQYHGYVCPIGYKNQRPEYLFVLCDRQLTSDQQNHLLETAACLIEYLELYQNTHQKQAEIHLLEHIVHRVGHQLRNPLGLIALYTETLCLTSNAQVQEQAGVIRDTVQHLLTHLTDLIYCGQSDRLNTSLQDLRTLIGESVAAFQPWIEQKQITVNYPNTSVLLQVDRLQIKQVLDNLLSNAIHFSPTNGKVTLNWLSFQGEVLIQISDQGSGLSTDELQKIFEPFYTRRPGGTGLGLTIAKKIVLDHHGDLWAQSLPEGGAQFSITLPRPLT